MASFDTLIFIGNSDFGRVIKEQQFTEHMLDKLLFGYGAKTTQLRRYKNLQRQPRRQISCLHLNNPYLEGHPRSCGECDKDRRDECLQCYAERDQKYLRKYLWCCEGRLR